MERVDTILLVDDESAVLHGIGQALESGGYSVTRCADGVEAIAWLHAHSEPNLLICDVHMPGVDGFELRQRARSMRPGLGVLLISGDPRVGADGDGPAAGAFLRKPFTRSELLNAVAQLIAGNRGAFAGNLL